VAFYAAMLAALNGKRTLILAPTTILAQQHYDTLKGMGWDDVELYGTDPIDAVQILRGRYDNHKSVVIGTHAILNNENLIRSASLIIIDEFQKFGVEQRAKATKHNPHLLLLSATPIPRTLASDAGPWLRSGFCLIAERGCTRSSSENWRRGIRHISSIPESVGLGMRMWCQQYGDYTQYVIGFHKLI
jgi:hypothetical protein